MQKIVTKTGKEIEVLWCGIATITDHALRFETVPGEMTMVEAFGTFTNPNETETLVHNFDEHSTIFTGYTVLKSIDSYSDGSILIALKGEEVGV